MKQLSLELEDDKPQKPSAYKGIYAMHKYWSKKPSTTVSNYISRHTQPGDLILDPFCGSGVVVIESVRMSRKAVGIDINPTAVFLTTMGLERVDIESLERSFKDLEVKMKELVERLYRTTCPLCDNENALATHYIWEDKKIIEVWVSCKSCKTAKETKPADSRDFDIVHTLGSPNAWYPTNALIENGRINAKPGMKVSDLFTNRALHVLSHILDEIESIEDKAVRNALKFCFSGSVSQSSRMVFVIRRRGKSSGEVGTPRTEVGSWVIGYWIPNEHFEINAWRCFANRYKRVLKGKKEILQAIPSIGGTVSSLESLMQKEQGYYVNVGNATSLPVLTDSVDYVFTDPPHGNRIPYLELSLMWNSWLRQTDIEWDNEIVVSDAKVRQKDSRDYHRRLSVALREIWRVLKPEKYMSVAFNSLDDKAWLSLLSSCAQAGFKLQGIEPLVYSATSVVQDNRKNALKTDFIVTFKKQSQDYREELILSENRNVIRRVIQRYLANASSASVQTYDILNHVIVMQVNHRKFTPIKVILEVLEKHFIYTESSWKL